MFDSKLFRHDSIWGRTRLGGVELALELPQTKTEGQLDKGQREGQTTLGNRSVFSRLNFI